MGVKTDNRMLLSAVIIIFLPIIASHTKVPDISPDEIQRLCDAHQNWICFIYNGSKTFNESCTSDLEKEELFKVFVQNYTNEPNQPPKVKTDLYNFLEETSCDIRQLLECREFEGNPNDHRCQCPDYENARGLKSVNPDGYFNGSKCVIKARGKCHDYLIPHRAQRFNSFVLKTSNSSGIRSENRTIDGRFQPSKLLCVKNAYCNVRKGKVHPSSRVESYDPSLYNYVDQRALREDPSDPTLHQCVCENEYYPDPDGECRRIEPLEWTRSQIYGLLLMLFTFALTLYLIVCRTDLDMYYDKGRARSF